jgi:hypothetical protein
MECAHLIDVRREEVSCRHRHLPFVNNLCISYPLPCAVAGAADAVCQCG